MLDVKFLQTSVSFSWRCDPMLRLVCPSSCGTTLFPARVHRNTNDPTEIAFACSVLFLSFSRHSCSLLGFLLLVSWVPKFNVVEVRKEHDSASDVVTPDLTRTTLFQKPIVFNEIVVFSSPFGRSTFAVRPLVNPPSSLTSHTYT